MKILAQRILHRYSRTKQKGNIRIHKKQLEEDFANDQMTIKEYIDPFTGAKNK